MTSANGGANRKTKKILDSGTIRSAYTSWHRFVPTTSIALEAYNA